MSTSPFAGTGELVRFVLRRDRVRLPAWTAGIFVFVLYLTVGIPAAYGTDDELATATVLFADPVGRLLTGPGYGFETPTVAGFIANGYGLYLMLLVALMSILLVVRHTRAEEQSGRAELVLAGAVHRRARLAATGVLVVVGVVTCPQGWAPRWVPATWALVGYGVVIGTFGPLLGLPDIMDALSPFSHPPQLPVGAIDAGGGLRLVLLLAVAGSLAGAGILGFSRRDLRSG